MLSQTSYQKKLKRIAQRLAQRTGTDNVDYAARLMIQDKSDRLVPYIPNKAQTHFLAHRTGRDLVLKARQHGISTAIQADNFVQSVTRRVRSATLAHDDVGTQLLRRMADRFWLGLPEPMRPRRSLDNATTTAYEATGSEVLIATAGGKNKGRAGTYTLVHGSEVAFWTDASAVMAGLMQGVPTEGSIVLESTPNGAQGWFYERCMEALDGNSDWALHFLPWWWSDDYAIALPPDERLTYTPDELALVEREHLAPEQIQWRRSKQRELGRLFAQEYPEDPRSCFLASGVGYFSDIRDLNGAFSAAPNAQPVTGHRYVAALDFGQASDYTALSVGDATTRQEVELWTDNRKPWADMRKHVLQTCQKWQVETLMPEANSMGTTNIEELVKEFRAAGCRTSIRAFETTAQSKPMMVTAFHWALDEGGLNLLPDAKGRAEIDAYVAKQTANGHWVYEGLPHDDTVIARMGMWHAMSSGQVRMGQSKTNVLGRG